MPDPTETFLHAHVLILGGAKGIGRAVAEELSRRGARLSVADIDVATTQETASALSAAGGEAQALQVDVLSAESIARAVTKARASFGPIDVLLNNVGAILSGDPQDIPGEEWERISDLNYRAVVYGVREVLPAMLERGSGHIVNTGSFAGMYPYASSRIPYAAAKAGVISLSQNLALYCEPRGIRVSCLIPGPVQTGIATTMTTWTPEAPMRGPGSELRLMTTQEAAAKFVNGLEEGRILIASDDSLWDIVRRWADDPDAFVRDKITQFEAGEFGMPQL